MASGDPSIPAVSSKPRRLHAKDLINVGIFTAIYFVVFFAVACLGYIPVLMLLIPFACPVIAGIPFMLFLTRVDRFGMVSIMGTILSILMLAMGHPWPTTAIAIVCAIAADVIMKAGNYRSWKSLVGGYAVFSEWLLGMGVPLVFMRDSYFATIRESSGDAYADALIAISPDWILVVYFFIIIAGAVLGAYLGRALMKKHFKRAGIA